MIMVFNTTFNNISAISWQSVLMVEETRVPGETADLPQVTENIITLFVSSTHHLRGVRTHNDSGDRH
jgi:hypothetical protein